MGFGFFIVERWGCPCRTVKIAGKRGWCQQLLKE